MKRPAPLVGQLLHLARSRGWSQARLAREAGIGLSTIGSWTSGTRRPLLEQLERICGALEVELLAIPAPREHLRD